MLWIDRIENIREWRHTLISPSENSTSAWRPLQET